MAKKPSINVTDGPLAAGFFSSETIKKTAVEPEDTTKMDAPSEPISPKNKGGRPRKANKKEQYTLTMDPLLYNKIRNEAAKEMKSISQFITDVMNTYFNN